LDVLIEQFFKAASSEGRRRLAGQQSCSASKELPQIQITHMGQCAVVRA